MKFNWNQSGMPVSLVSRVRKSELAEFKTVLSDAGNHVMQPVDAESMARELAESGGRNVVEMVRDLTTALQSAERELESANRRYERLVGDLRLRGISVADDGRLSQESEPANVEEVATPTGAVAEPAVDADAEWEEWDRRFRALLD